MNTTTKAGYLALMSAELIQMLYDARWLLLFMLLCVIVDFRLGRGESNKRYGEAEQLGNHTLMDKYKWHGSRARRRTVNKLFDYLLWICVGMFLGKALLEPWDIPYYFGGVVLTIISAWCEISSIFGHFFYLHGVGVESRTIKGFFKALTVALAKRKNEDLGEALEDAFEKTEHERVPENDKSGTH